MYISLNLQQQQQKKSLFFSNLRHTNVHKCMKMYICVHLYTFDLQKNPDLWDVHPGYISSASRVHLNVRKCLFNLSRVGPTVLIRHPGVF